MSITFRKEAGLKYTDMCIYIDAHMKECVEPGVHQDVEDKIIQYLYHIIYALACKKSFFKRFDDYDDFALYSAGELFISMRNRYINEGKIVRGKPCVPVKSCLNFIKSVLFPLKVNYQKQSYTQVLNPEINSELAGLENKVRDEVRQQYQSDLTKDLTEILELLPKRILKILNQTPYRNDELMIKRLYLSCLLTFINDITIPNKLKEKLNKKSDSISDEKRINIYNRNETNVILWHLDERLANYVRILVVRIKRIFTDEIVKYRSASDLSDELVDSILKTAYASYDNDRGEF